MTTKAEMKTELVRRLAEDLANAERAQEATAEGATHEEAKPENDKDTRALEQSYLARGQARRVEELRAELALVRAMPERDFAPAEPVSLGARVRVEDEEGAPRTFFIAPGRGGTVLDCGPQVVTPRSPLGRALLGKRAGDACEVPAVKGGRRELQIVEVD